MQEGKSKLIQAVRAVREQIYAAVKKELLDDSRTYESIARANNISTATVQRIAGSLNISRPVGPRPRTYTSEVNNGN